MSDLLLHSRSPIGGDVSTLITVDPMEAGWQFCSLTVIRLAAGTQWQGQSGPNEIALVPLSGSCTVASNGQEWTIGGRSSVTDGLSSSLYLPIASDYSVVAIDALEIAICGSRAEQTFPARLIPAGDIEIEIRGAGNAARQINHIIKPEFPAQRLLVVEVITPSGNWSSYPPHKHDVSQMPAEADLEEIYYYRIDPADGFALQRLYTGDGRIDEAWTIHDGDLLLVPEGYHAFTVAHGYTGYYLNILAGADPIRTMQPADDPDYAWVRATWTDELNEGARSWRDIDRHVNRGAGQRPTQEAS
ncbi:5-deoxy-glucuronate isomerase [soil metagenome]